MNELIIEMRTRERLYKQGMIRYKFIKAIYRMNLRMQYTDEEIKILIGLGLE